MSQQERQQKQVDRQAQELAADPRLRQALAPKPMAVHVRSALMELRNPAAIKRRAESLFAEVRRLDRPWVELDAGEGVIYRAVAIEFAALEGQDVWDAFHGVSQPYHGGVLYWRCEPALTEREAGKGLRYHLRAAFVPVEGRAWPEVA